MSILAIAYAVLMFSMFVLFVVDAIRFRSHVFKYFRIGLFFALIAISLDLIALKLIFARDPDGLSLPFAFICGADVAVFVKMVIFTCVGMYCCSMIRNPSVPLVRRALRLPADDAKPVDWPRAVLWALVVAVAASGYSWVLLKATSPRISEMLQKFSEAVASSLGASAEPSLLVAVAVVAFAFSEEVLFRLGIQNFLAKNLRLDGSRYWGAIVATAALWSLAHANTLDPEWVKLVQVFPIGLALGYLARKYGVEVCILAHAVFNIVMMFLAAQLIEV